VSYSISGGFWDEKSRDAKIFAVALLTPTSPLLKIGGQNDFFGFHVGSILNELESP